MRRTFPQVDGAISLSSAQFMYLGDVSQSVQLQLNNLRDGSATANNAINSRFANSASVANNALSLGGFAAAAYPRLAAANAFTALQTMTVNGEALRVAGTNVYMAAFNAAQTTRLGFIQWFSDNRLIINNEMSGPIDLHCTTIRHNGVSTVWHAGNDGGGSGLDADFIDGYNASEAATASTVAARNSSGYLFAVYFANAEVAETGGEARVPADTTVWWTAG